MAESFALWALEYGRYEIEDALTKTCKQQGYVPSDLAVIYDESKDQFSVVEQEELYRVLHEVGFDQTKIDVLKASEHPDRVLLVAAKFDGGAPQWSALRFAWTKTAPVIGMA